MWKKEKKGGGQKKEGRGGPLPLPAPEVNLYLNERL